MASLIYLVYSILTLLVHEEPTTRTTLIGADSECTRPNEISVCQCPTERNCGNWNETIDCPTDPDICFPGCACKPGYVYGPKGDCIQPDQCTDPSKCSDDEDWTETEGGCEHTCENPDGTMICPRMKVPGCICKKGTVRGPDKDCIPASQCPGSSESRDCPRGEEYTETEGGCELTCENPDGPVICPKIQEPGCICRLPKVRGPDNICIPASQCPRGNFFPDRQVKAQRGRKIPKESHDCPRGEEWSEKDGGCEHTCENPDGPLICPKTEVEGCICREPKVRGPDNICIPASQCPRGNSYPDRRVKAQRGRKIPKAKEESCPPGETWGCVDCQETCDDVGQKKVCPRMCSVEGCVCEYPGQVRGPNNQCIDPPLCPAAEVYPEKPIRAQRGRKIPKEKEGSCPPGEEWGDCANCEETCDDVGDEICTEPCVEGCVCRYPGQIRGPDNKCIAPPLCPSTDIDPDNRDKARRSRKFPKA